MSDNNEKVKRRLNKIKIGELSAVTKPMQEGATSVIMKRFDRPVLMTLADDSGHSHLLELDKEWDKNQTSYSVREGDENSHQHPYIIKDGKAVIGETLGHSHEVDTDNLNQTLMTMRMIEAIKEDLEREENSTYKSLSGVNSLIKKLATKESSTHKPASDGGVSKSEVVKMATDEITVDDLKKNLDKVTAELAFAKAFGELGDNEKVHYLGLSKAKAEKFLALSKAERQAELDEIKKADPIVYTSESGEVFHKSDDSRLVKMAKERDEDRKELQKQKDANETQVFTKRAEVELKFMPGTVETRVALLKSVETIEDEAVKAEVLKSLAAKNASLGKNFEVVGDSTGVDVDIDDSVGKLDSMAKAHAAKEGVDFFTAYDVVSKANPELLAKAVQG